MNELDLSEFKLFKDSPDSSHPDCKCSRCDKVIETVPLRLFVNKGEGGEYRFHIECRPEGMFG